MTGNRVASAIFLSTMLVMTSFALSPASAEAPVDCCTSTDFDLFLIGESTDGSLTPFQGDLDQEYSVLVTPSIGGEVNIGSWEVIWGIDGSYPEHGWTFNMPYKVEGAVGVTINSTLDIKIGGSIYSGDAGIAPYLTGEGDLQITVNVDAGEIRDGDLVELSLSVRSLLFSSPGEDAGLRFLWGSEDYTSKISTRFPLLEITAKDASVKGRLIYFPIIINSGFDDRMWSSSSGGISVQNTELSEKPIATRLDSGVEVTFVWEAPEDAQSGTYSIRFHLEPQSGLEVSMSRTHEITIGEDTGSTGWYPASEPLQSGGSDLEIDLDVKFDGDSMNRVVSITFDGAMSQWMRWGLDNIGNESLNSNSWWRNLKTYSDSVPSVEKNNGRVDDSELLALTAHLTGSGSDLRSFISDGLSLEIESLVGVNPVDLGPTEITLDMGGTRAFNAEAIIITIDTSSRVELGSRQLLVENFIRNPGNDYWQNIDLDIEIKTTMLAGLGAISAEEIDYSHRRWIFMEMITVDANELDPELVYRIEFLPTANMAFSPLISAMISVFALCAAIGMGLLMTRKRVSVPSLLTVVTLGGLAFIVYVLGMPMQIVLGIVGSSILLVFPVALVSPRLDPSNNPRRGSGPTIQCPACDTINSVESNVRPLRFECKGCDVILRIEE
ncbi:MAG: hypothetical protein CMA61_00070 [Euryarchaeota archaeon]|jgi:hypothetical protein|nr:hypothetical protein [Euryarchaeota archaeon]